MKQRTRIRWLVALLLVVPLLASQALAVDQEKRAEVAKKKAEVLEQSIVAEGGDVSPDPSMTITKPGIQAVDPAGKAPLDNAITCMARSLYWETKGQNAATMEAVANVMMNRLSSDEFPDTICEVVKQGGEQGACQFSWWCDGRADEVKEEDSYLIVKEVTRKALNQQLEDRTDGALFFHQRSISPRWASAFLRTAEVGKLLFYKPQD
ncbi:cell wall hydrolase [Pistricoccus aurantiacus]|uniref:Cell wall hydrolase n=1 Tax=Pistricoccus aurantiacus TaxID=1883414 RepID=A0A5B8STB9_9GAMM|nr:cell wall hydrolase [Pistricoccus aurantiacus]QEA39554.1 cell wall hydrolase [Pistricoccus aurantiacus]